MPFMSRRGLVGFASALGVNSVAVQSAAASTTAPACTPPCPAGAQPATIERSESATVTWRDRRLRIDIAYPNPVDPDLPLMIRGTKPVPIYVLDGDTHFPMAVSTTRLMQWGGEVPPCLVVGIKYDDSTTAYRENWRARDLTPTKDPRPGRADANTVYGEGAQFRHFLTDVLRPMVERRFDVNGTRAVLIGHSFGGLFSLDAMVQAPSCFGNYLAISPALWFDDNIVLRQLAAKLRAGRIFPGRVAVFAGEQEERISPRQTHMTSNILEFGRLVADYRRQFPAGALVSIVPGANHHTVSGEAIARGLRFLIAPEDRRSETF